MLETYMECDCIADGDYYTFLLKTHILYGIIEATPHRVVRRTFTNDGERTIINYRNLKLKVVQGELMNY
ncbi:MAG: hypothetical protein DRI89_09190 [Bacteroidetes bacterium]|nr:MAG: hypothetical protein DRI89_09190 [Bacteroidota bacterium]